MAMRARCMVLALLLAACAAESAGHRLQRIGMTTDGHLLLVRRTDFPSGDPRQGTPTTLGSAALRDAVIADAGVAAFVAAHGLPDAIAVVGLGFTLHLAYLREDKLYTLEHSAAEVLSPRAWTPSHLTGERPLAAAEVAAIDPDRGAEQLRALVKLHDRLQAVGRRLLRAAPPVGPPMEDYGILLVTASEPAARAFGGEADGTEKIVAWVDPEGPQRDVLRPGDRVTAVAGVQLALAERTGFVWEGPKRLTIRRDGTASEVEIIPASWPHRLRFVIWPEQAPNASAAGGGTILVTSGLMEIFPEDAAVAFVVGHEMAHFALAHGEPGGVVSQLASGVAALGTLPVLLPVVIASPETGRQVAGAIKGGFSREAEREADRRGMRYARDAGYDPRAALTVFDRLRERAPLSGLDQFLDLHPPYPERRAIIEAELPQQ